ncbi:MAG: class II aldolase/adducin family protein [Gammaproteobacteria bacterium]|nr:class II aldolase/adducin family protein [Gammaproteobacteria bacterium]
MTEQEGVIKYQLVFRDAEPLLDHDYSALNHWHRQFKKTGILGQDPQRYNGLGFGNLSQRIDRQSFLISGTQTGGLDELTPEDYALVTRTDIRANRVEAEGRVKPSSESLTHAAVYAFDDQIQYVFHVHSPGIWHARARLEIPETAADIAYGTPQMAHEMNRLYQQGEFASGNILAMAGHEDGIIGFGSTADEAGELIMRMARRKFPGL